MGYQNQSLSYENLSKAVTRLPNYLRKQFYEATRQCDLTNGTTNLLSFESWLEKCINSLAEIIQNTSNTQDSFNREIFSKFMNNNTDKKLKEKEKGPDEQELQRAKRVHVMTLKGKAPINGL